MWPSKSFSPAEVSNSSRFARPQSARRFRERIPFLVRTPSPSALFRATTTRFNLANGNGIPSSSQGVRARITFYIINISPALRYAFFSKIGSLFAPISASAIIAILCAALHRKCSLIYKQI